LTKFQSIRWFHLGLLLVSVLFVGGMAGCSTTDYKAAMLPPDQAADPAVPRLTVGDEVTVSLTDIPEPPAPEPKPIQGDGTISMPYVGRVLAAGKTPGELEVYIHGLYVPAIYTHLTVTVKATSDRVYFVRGEVKQPGRLIYVGPITVTKAITSAGDFTDFANRRRVFLVRSNGQRFKLNCIRILNGDVPDPPVFPGDQIEVKRRWY
jgi:polysaccharide export outer membrane protein